MEFFKYEKVKNFEYKIIEETSKTKIGEISFPSPVITIYPENNFVYIDFIEPKKENFSAIVLLHSFLEREKGITKLLSNYLSKGDFGVYLICLPYHRKRTPKNYKNGQLFLTTNFERSINAYRQAVIDTLVFIDWLNERKEVKNIGIVGISLGAFILNTIMGIDRRIKCGVSILGAGNIHYIFVRSILTLPLVFYGFTHGIRIKDYKKVTKDYIKYLKDIKEKGIDNVDCKWKWFLIDPLTYAHLNNPRKVLMINGYFDLIVPFSAVIQLWKALGKPEKLFLPCSHISSRFFLNLIFRKTYKFLKKNLL